MSANVRGLDTFAELAAKLDALKTEFAKELLERVQSYTPVATGRLKEAWKIKVEDGAVDILNDARNNEGVPYAEYVEFGTANMRGYFMATRTVAEAPEILEHAKKKVGL